MPAQDTIPPAANVLGTIGTILWCIQLAPQIYTNWKTKTTEGLPPIMMLLFAASAPPFGVYAILQNLNIPVQLQPQFWGTLSVISFAQCLYYGPPSNRFVARYFLGQAWRCFFLGAVIVALFGGAEAALIYTLRPIYEAGNELPLKILGASAAALLGIALLPPYFEMWKRNGKVVGIDFIFLLIDWTGGLFSIFSLVAQNSFDVLGSITYGVVLVLEGGIFLSHGLWIAFHWKEWRGERRAIKANEADKKAAKKNLKKNPLPESTSVVEAMGSNDQPDLEAGIEDTTLSVDDTPTTPGRPSHSSDKEIENIVTAEPIYGRPPSR